MPTQNIHLGPRCLAVIAQLAFIQEWPLREVPLYIYRFRVDITSFWVPIKVKCNHSVQLRVQYMHVLFVYMERDMMLRVIL